MNINRIITYITFIILVLTITIPSIITVKNRHNEKLFRATINKITEKAKTCFDKDECQKKEITLNELYNKGYLERIINPVTKEYYDINSYIIINGENVTFIEVRS